MSTTPSRSERVIETLTNTQGGRFFKEIFEQGVADQVEMMEKELTDILGHNA